MSGKMLTPKPYPLGAHMEEGMIRFSFVSFNSDCGVLLYDKKGRQIKKLAFTPEDKIGNVYCKYVADIEPDAVSYLFYEGERIVIDERARAYERDAIYGKECRTEEFKAGFVTDSFDWENDRNPRILYKDALVYCLHVRGFTRHKSSGVKSKGTFSGLVEKIPYLKEIGVTTVELQPSYEFAEKDIIEGQKEKTPACYKFSQKDFTDILEENKLNYWGYKKGFYYTPKAAYAASKNPVRECKEMVKAFHANNMEVVMQFYFTQEVSAMEIADILHYWVIEYHVDGFHLMVDGILPEFLAGDPVLAETKLWYYYFDTAKLYGKDEGPSYCNLAEYNDSWYYCMRKYLKGDENMLANVLYHMRHVPEKCGCIHYLSNYFGFTINDLVSYDYKHNEENGEENRDGMDYNYSWNCGEEGPKRKGKVKQLRIKQIKNAYAFLLLSQSTPLIFMGDEFGNSQNGNNNPYCLDHEITWLDWTLVKRNSEIFEFWKMLVHFRHHYSMLMPQKESCMLDYLACGYPDLSYHGENAWKVQLDPSFRHVGIMLCGRYAQIASSREEGSIYIAMNMHWEKHSLALPKPSKGKEWKEAFATAESEPGTARVEESKATVTSKGLMIEIPPRSIAVYITENV